MNFKKTIAKSLIVAMALGMVPVANLQTAKAAVTALKLDGTTGLASATGAKYWGIAKKVATAGKGTVAIDGANYKISNIQEYVGEVDLYSVLKGKAGFIAMGEKEDPTAADANWVVKELPAADTSFKVYYLADKDKAKIKGLSAVTKAVGGDYGYILATTGKSTVEEVEFTDANLEAKLNDGAWQAPSKLFGAVSADKVTEKLKSFVQTGSTLTFRLKGGDNKWASKEAKLKVASQAKGPGIKVDPTKGTTSIKKGMQWQKVELTNDVKPGATWTTASKAVPFSELGISDNKGYALFVRTAPTDKKIGSKITRVDLKAPAAALTIPELKDQSVAIGNDLKLDLVLAYDVTKGATLTNNNKDKTYEYALGKTADGLKWNTLKAATENKKTNVVKPTVAKLAYSSAEKANTWGVAGVQLFLREAGAKQNGNELTLPGVAANKEIKLTNVAQALKVATEVVKKPDNADITITDATDSAPAKADIKMNAKTAGQFVIKPQIEKAVKTGKNAKVKLKTSGVKGVAVKAGVLDQDGKFELTIDVKNTTFKEDPSGTLTIEVTYESVKAQKILVNFAKKS